MSVYPAIGDWDAYVRERTPNTLRDDNSFAFVSSTLAAFRDLDNTQFGIVQSLDPNVAVGDQLDKCGARVGEPRGGLGDFEYRRIILGREAAGTANGTYNGIRATWIALSGALPDRVHLFRWGPADTPLVWMWAEVGVAPSEVFLRRAGAVLLDAVAFPMDVTAQMCLPPVLTFGGPYGLGVGLVSYTLETTR